MQKITDARDRLAGLLSWLPIWLVWMGGLIPLGLLVADGFAGHLGADPVVAVEHRLGRTALWFIGAGLAATPLIRWTGLPLGRFRKAVGLLGFGYALLLVLAWGVIDMGGYGAQMLHDLVKRPYLLFGALAFGLLLVPALISGARAQKRLGMARWSRLQFLVWPAAALAVLHYLWVGKVTEAAPLAWAAWLIVAFALRHFARRA